MTTTIPTTIYKTHGMGNDFCVFFDLSDKAKTVPYAETPLTKQQVEALCNRHLGIGADGVIRILQQVNPEDRQTYYFMDYYNQDGSFAKMCGNGIRVAALLIESLGYHDFETGSLDILTRSGIKTITKSHRKCQPECPDTYYLVDMGEFEIVEKDCSYQFDDVEVSGGIAINVGNDHVVFETTLKHFYDEFLSEISLNYDANIEFVEIDEVKGEIKMRVFERGVGETLSCGTGICASAIFAMEKYDTDEWGVSVPGGKSYVHIKGENVFLEGPAKLVAKIELEQSFLNELNGTSEAAEGFATKAKGDAISKLKGAQK